jgi:hypothetical protein
VDSTSPRRARDPVAGLFQPFFQLGDGGLIERRLFARQVAEGLDLGLVRQIGNDALVALEAAQDIGLHEPTQRRVGDMRLRGEARSLLISSMVRISPSRLASTRKSSSASMPRTEGDVDPTVASTEGRLGRFMCQLAGMRMTRPARSIASTSWRKRTASCGVQRRG